MKRNNPNSGFTLIEMLVGALCMIIVGIGCYTLVRTGYDSQWMLMNQNNSNMNARTGVDTLEDKLRGMTTLTAATGSDITFTDNAGSSIRYWRNTGDNTLRTTTGGQPNGGTNACRGLTSLVFLYYSYNGVSWAASSTPATLANVGAVDITATVNLNGYSRRVFSSVKLRSMRFNNINGF
jgi:type II secretory pathway pseudopilin PulG